jgi:hypothetical protein
LGEAFTISRSRRFIWWCSNCRNGCRTESQATRVHTSWERFVHFERTPR